MTFTETVAAARSGPSGGLMANESFWAWEQDRQLRYTHVIPVAVAPALDPRSTVGHTRWQLPDARPLHGTWAEHRQRVSERLPFHNFRYLVFAGTGHPRCLSESGEPQFDGTGKFAGYRGTTRDITQQWQQQQRLEQAEGLLQVAATIARFGAWMVDLDTGRVSWTREASAIHRMDPRASAAGVDQALARYVPEHRELLRHAFRACVKDGIPFDLELQALTTAGARKWVRILGVARRDAQGNVAFVQGAYQDIHGAKLQAEALRESEERLRTTLDSLTDGFITVDRQWRIGYVNPACETIVGMRAGDMLQRSFWDVFPAASESEFGANYREAMDRRCERRFEALYAPLGLWCRVSAFPTPQGIAISFTDITAARQAQESLEQANADLERRVRERTEQLRQTNDELASFTVAAAHDLRAPLASIDGFSRALAESLPAGVPERLRHFAGRIRAGAARMESLLDALLELSRVGRAELQPRQVNLTMAARSAARSLAETAPGRPAQVEVQDGLTAWGDTRLLRTLVENLLGNAWHLTAGRDPARIVVGQRADGAFFVRDNGPGFDERRAAEVFAPFRRLPAGGDFDGIGMGLATARRIVERHGGRLWAETVPGESAVFYFTLDEPPA